MMILNPFYFFFLCSPDREEEEESKKNQGSWIEHMLVGEDGFSDPPGIRVCIFFFPFQKREHNKIQQKRYRRRKKTQKREKKKKINNSFLKQKTKKKTKKQKNKKTKKQKNKKTKKQKNKKTKKQKKQKNKKQKKKQKKNKKTKKQKKNKKKTKKKKTKKQVRAIPGMAGCDFLGVQPIVKEKSYVFGPLISALRDVGYTNSNLTAATYDWRLPPSFSFLFFSFLSFFFFLQVRSFLFLLFSLSLFSLPLSNSEAPRARWVFLSAERNGRNILLHAQTACGPPGAQYGKQMYPIFLDIYIRRGGSRMGG